MEDNLTADEYPLRPALRAGLGLWTLFLLAGFALAASLTPDSRGFGTHQRLGLPPCTFQVMFDIPCPSCGMTTCFANFVRGRWIAAIRANVAGVLLAMFCAIQIPWIWWSIYRGRLWKISQPDLVLLWILMSLSLVAVVQWIVRIVIDS